MSDLFDVAVVGFGPSGAVAAALLGQAGLKTFVCDRAVEVYDKPRAIALDHEILRVFQQIGVIDQIEPHIEPFTDSLYFGVDGQLIKRMSTVQPPYPMGYVPSMVFTQPPVEAALRARVQSLPNVEISLGNALRRITQDDALATLELEDSDGTERTVRARYVVACDGASSTVREQVGIRLEDLDFDEAWLVVDVLVNDQGLAKLPQTSVQYCEPDRPCTLVIGPKNHRRWEIALHDDEDPKHMATPEGAWSVLNRWLTPDDAQLWRQASYRFHALVADRWQIGRVFVAGDAAHQQPPFLGQGMCQGVRDVTNLSWKLAAVLHGRAKASLLETYGIERKQHVTQLTTRIKHIGELVGERDLGKARARDAALLAECSGVVKTTPRQDVQPALSGGLIADGSHPAIGTLFPQPWIQSNSIPVRFDSLAGTGWRLVLDEFVPWAPGAEEQATLNRLQVKPVRIGCEAAPDILVEADGVTRAWFRRHDCSAALVRPDHYVFGVSDAGTSISALLSRLKAAAP
jgi:3-(3-hydroxy-phenyl)propionate hydroxylase